MDILDELQAVKGFVRLELYSGEIVFGKPDCIVYDVDDDGDVTKDAVYYGLDEIKSFREINQ